MPLRALEEHPDTALAQFAKAEGARLRQEVEAVRLRETEEDKQGTVSDKDAMIYAINPWAIPFDHRDSDPPRILQAGITIGPPNVEVDPKAMKVVGSDYEFRGFIQKAPKEEGKAGEKISTGVFQQKEYAWLSALLCSRAEAVIPRATALPSSPTPARWGSKVLCRVTARGTAARAEPF
jgi:hypothetical protein